MESRSIRKISFSKLNKQLLLLNVVLIALFFLSQIFITTILGTKSTEIETIRQQKDDLRLQNEIMNSKIDELKTISKVEEIIKKDDLKQKNVEYLNSPGVEDVALNR